MLRHWAPGSSGGTEGQNWTNYCAGKFYRPLRTATLISLADPLPVSDLLFAEIVNELKTSYPFTLEAAIPYPGRMKTPDKTFQRLIRCCDVVKIHAAAYFKGCYMCRNLLHGGPVSASDCRLRRKNCGRNSGNGLRYAKGKEVRVVWFSWPNFQQILAASGLLR